MKRRSRPATTPPQRPTGRWLLAAALASGAAAGCGDRRGTAGDAPPAASTANPAVLGVQSRVSLADSLGWGEAGALLLEAANRSAAPVAGARLALWLPATLAVPDSALRAVAAARAPGGALLLPLGALPAGQARQVTLTVRTPPLPPGDTAGPPPVVVRSGVVGADGRALGPVSTDTLALRPPVLAAICGGADARVARYGIGGVRLGMRADAVRATCPAARDTTWTAEGARETGLVFPLGATPVLAVLKGDSVARIVVAARGLATPAGVGVGSTLADLRARYGRLCAGTEEGRTAVWFPNAPGISFGLSTAVSAPGARRAAAAVDSALLLPDTATVAQLWVRRGTDDCPSAAAARANPSPDSISPVPTTP